MFDHFQTDDGRECAKHRTQIVIARPNFEPEVRIVLTRQGYALDRWVDAHYIIAKLRSMRCCIAPPAASIAAWMAEILRSNGQRLGGDRRGHDYVDLRRCSCTRRQRAASLDLDENDHVRPVSVATIKVAD